MPNQITWVEPDRAEIPSGWPIIIDGENGTAYEDATEYLSALDAIYAAQAINPIPE